MGKMAVNQSRLQEKKKKEKGRKEVPTNKTPGTGCGTRPSLSVPQTATTLFSQPTARLEEIRSRFRQSRSQQKTKLSIETRRTHRLPLSPTRRKEIVVQSCRGWHREHAVVPAERAALGQTQLHGPTSVSTPAKQSCVLPEEAGRAWPTPLQNLGQAPKSTNSFGPTQELCEGCPVGRAPCAAPQTPQKTQPHFTSMASRGSLEKTSGSRSGHVGKAQRRRREHLVTRASA